jgi:ATP-dependent exoDNAse (exonuclease V) beta subunit
VRGGDPGGRGARRPVLTSLRVVRAAAGCGKTTDLAARYLAGLAAGVPASQAIAITFTRRAAAELVERVATALRACLPDEAGAAARARLGPVWTDVYAPVCPADPEVARRALAALPEAPIGTTDTFVARLLAEFALDAGLPLPDGTVVPLDVPFGAGVGVGAALGRAARRVLDPPGDAPPGAALRVLTAAYTLDELVPQLARRGPWDHLPLARTEDVLGPWAAEAGRLLWRLPFAAVVEPAPPGDPAAWEAALAPLTLAGGRWAVPAVAAWAAEGCDPARTPLALFGWLAAVSLSRKAGKTLRAAIEAREVPLGPGTLDLWSLAQALRAPFDDPAAVARADALRDAREVLRREVVSAGLREAALAGELGYDELLEAAVHLCEAPPPALIGRFRTLLVDEVQDANPGQHRLYAALARIPGTEAVFVGDARQSIYLFRDAEPELLRRLEEAHADPRELRVNRRSTPALVASHRALFDALDPPMRARRWRPIASLATLEADPANEARALRPDHHPDPNPVHVVVPDDLDAPRDDEIDVRVLEHFLGRLRAAWAEPGHERDTAVVLANNWSVAERACRWIRARAGRADAAFVEGSAGRGGSRALDDLRLFLRALSSDDDEIAWLGVWRHPAVGLTDAALARAAAGVGLLARDESGRRSPWREGKRTRLGWWLGADALGPPHDPVDAEAFARAAPALRAARDTLGRRPTAQVLDRLFDALDLRTLLWAGPGGADDAAELEVLLDVVRDRDARGLPPDAVLAELSAEGLDRPAVRVERPAGHVACTTLFQAKGLAWDHVCVLRPGHLVRGRLDGEARDAWAALPDGSRVRLEGVSFDPDGGLSEVRDPLGRLAVRLHHLRLTEECARFAYVAITRARRSVTLGVARKPRPPRAREETQLKDLLSAAWTASPLPGVSVVPRPPVPAVDGPSTGWAVPTDAPAPARVPPPPGWDERAPSSLAASLSTEDRARFAASIAAQVRLQNGWFRGAEPVSAPGTDPRTGRGLPGHPLGRLTPADWGTLVHGWFAAWGFRGPPDADAVSAYLAAEWPGGADPELAAFLRAVSDRVASAGGPLWALVTDPAAKLRFEHPLLGVARLAGREVSLAGRMDLLVERPRGRCAVIDFKAGHRAPTGWDDLVEGASLRTYAFQLHAYAASLQRLGRTVETVGLWFVRSGAQVTWRP